MWFRDVQRGILFSTCLLTSIATALPFLSINKWPPRSEEQDGPESSLSDDDLFRLAQSLIIAENAAQSRKITAESASGGALRREPETDYNARQLIESKGYPFEEYQVETLDHYLLTIHRIPGPRHNLTADDNSTKPVVFLQHGLLSCSDEWVLNLENESLDAGYDVFLGNVRGNRYSRANTRLSPQSSAFWQFSFDEMAAYDLPTMVDFAASKAGVSQLNYIGMSQGTLIGFIGFAQYPEWSKNRIRQFHALAPIAHLNHVKSPIDVFVSRFTSELQLFFKLFGYNEFLPINSFVHFITNLTCDNDSPEAQEICHNIAFTLVGYDRNIDNTNVTRIPVYMGHFPAGTSSQNIAHYGQMIHQKRFQRFDYGFLGNLWHYRRPWPPAYDLSKYDVPTALYWGARDVLADAQDVARLELEIHDHVIASFKCDSCNHIDFQVGMNAPYDVYPNLMRVLKQGQ